MHRAAAATAVLVLSVVLFSGCRSSQAKHTGPAVSPPGQFLSRTITVAGKRHRYRVYLPPGYNHQTEWPVILSLHGTGECGTDGTRPSEAGLGEALRATPSLYPCIVVFPQTSAHLHYWTDDFDQALATLNASAHEFGGDPHRLYLTGYSLGGSGTWFLAARHPGVFAAIAPVCGRIAVQPDRARDPLIHSLVTARDPYAAVAARIGRTPVWVFHGQDDPIVPVQQSRHITAALKAHGGNIRLTEYPGVGHTAWVNAYADPDLPRWLLSQRLPTP
jgi:predicted peptidase